MTSTSYPQCVQRTRCVRRCHLPIQCLLCVPSRHAWGGIFRAYIPRSLTRIPGLLRMLVLDIANHPRCLHQPVRRIDHSPRSRPPQQGRRSIILILAASRWSRWKQPSLHEQISKWLSISADHVVLKCPLRGPNNCVFEDSICLVPAPTPAPFLASRSSPPDLRYR